MRVLVVDDDPMVRTALRMYLGGDPGISLVGEAAHGAEALELVAERGPDVVLMDIRMPVMDGLTATERLLEGDDPPHVIVLTTFDTDDFVLRALGAGAAGFLLKDTPPARLVEAVRSVARGEPMLSPSVTAQLIAKVSATAAASAPPGGERATRARDALARLTVRELEVARAVARGMSNAEISAELYLSLATVKTHVGRVLTKCDLDNRVQIALLVRDAEGAS